MPKLLIDLPPDVVQHILARIQLAHHIARAAPTCHVVSVAARNAIKERKFSREVVTLAGHTDWRLQPLRRGCAGTLDLRCVSRSFRIECEEERRAKEKASRDVDRKMHRRRTQVVNDDV